MTKINLDTKMIKNYLTIRYNPVNPPIPALNWKHLLNKTSDTDGHVTENLLIRSVKKPFMEKEKTIVVSLSSGIDSTLCLAILRKVFPHKKIVAICAVFSTNFDESIRAKEIAKKFGAEFKVITVDSIFTRMPELVAITGKPRWNTYQYIIANEARKFGKVLVTGDGADEIFGGYTFRYNKFLSLLKPNYDWKSKVLDYLECHNRDWVPDQKDMFGRKIKFNWETIYNYFKPYFLNRLNPLEQIMLADFNGKLLFDFIPTGMAISKHYHLRGLPMFLDEDVINFGTRLPMEQKYNHLNQRGKIVLRKIAKRLGVDHIDEKKGFSPDLIIDWNTHGKQICEKYLLDKNSYIFDKGLISHAWVLEAFEKINDDGDIRYLNRIISILALEIWYRIFISKELDSKQKLS